MSQPVLTLANQLTILRMALAPVLMVLVLFGRMQAALAVFVIAGVTDLLDGFVARITRQQTQLGAVLDPVADKVLLSSAFVVLTWSSHLFLPIPVWLTVITLSRDAIIIASVAIINLTLGRRVFYPTWLGKTSTVLQLVTVGVVLLLNAFRWDLPPVQLLFDATLAFTVASALHYVYLASTGRSGTEA